MNDRDPQLQNLFRLARDQGNPTALERERVGRLLQDRIAAGGMPVLAATTQVAFPAIKVVGVALATFFLGGGAVWYGLSASPSVAPDVHPVNPRQVPLSSVAPVAPPRVIVPVSSGVEPKVGLPGASPRMKSVRPNRSTVSDDLAGETRLLGQVNEALQQGRPAAALAMLRDYRLRFPSAILNEEMQATRLIARCQNDASGDARMLARAFVKQHPQSPVTPRVKRACLDDAE